jgi:hypothetical protein
MKYSAMLKSNMNPRDRIRLQHLADALNAAIRFARAARFLADVVDRKYAFHRRDVRAPF